MNTSEIAAKVARIEEEIQFQSYSSLVDHPIYLVRGKVWVLAKEKAYWEHCEPTDPKGSVCRRNLKYALKELMRLRTPYFEEIGKLRRELKRLNAEATFNPDNGDLIEMYAEQEKHEEWLKFHPQAPGYDPFADEDELSGVQKVIELLNTMSCYDPWLDKYVLPTGEHVTLDSGEALDIEVPLHGTVAITIRFYVNGGIDAWPEECAVELADLLRIAEVTQHWLNLFATLMVRDSFLLSEVLYQSVTGQWHPFSHLHLV